MRHIQVERSAVKRNEQSPYIYRAFEQQQIFSNRFGKCLRIFAHPSIVLKIWLLNYANVCVPCEVKHKIWNDLRYDMRAALYTETMIESMSKTENKFSAFDDWLFTSDIPYENWSIACRWRSAAINRLKFRQTNHRFIRPEWIPYFSVRNANGFSIDLSLVHFLSSICTIYGISIALDFSGYCCFCCWLQRKQN